jgi:hypothetical protein
LCSESWGLASNARNMYRLLILNKLNKKRITLVSLYWYTMMHGQQNIKPLVDTASSLSWLHDHTRKDPLDEWSARRRDLYLTTHNIQKRQRFIRLAGFDTSVPESERPQIHNLDWTHIQQNFYFECDVSIISWTAQRSSVSTAKFWEEKTYRIIGQFSVTPSVHVWDYLTRLY